MATFYDFTTRAADGTVCDLSAYRGQVLLMVNTASECGYTRQYAGLQELQDFFAGQGFSVLGFPCNQFGGQEPGGADEILAFCQSRFGVSFPLMAKLEVNGAGADPLWRWLTQADSDHPHPVKWNFTKFLIDARGRVVKRYEPAVEPHELVDDIKALLAR
ncbi:glutathione peroxidase [Chromobacterium subtsugae]|uniref:glutathione peroxidase n=1 Tax=Chromobacterium subtsugae TaxID=251747 RepID=UPI000641873A|nr:glutathione peroxidase [Chromobacterium subtsugae]